MSSSDKYIRFDAAGVEPVVENEDIKTAEIEAIINSTQQKNFACHRHAFRATHVKTQGVVKGTLTILPDLPQELAQAIASPDNATKQHDIAIRFANEPIFLTDDRTAGPRGLAMKVFNVSGSFLDPAGEESHTQDLLFNNAPTLELKDVTTCLEIFHIRNDHFFEPAKLAMNTLLRSDRMVQAAPVMLPNHHFLAYTMFSQAAYRWGPYVVKYALFPSTETQEKLASTHKITSSHDIDQHSKWLQEWFKNNSAEFDLRVQLLENLDEQSVEDATMEWDQSKYPFRTVGKVNIPAGQDSFNAKRRIFWEEKMKLNPWYGLEEMRPLGSVNRLRRNVYKASRKYREQTNATETKAISSVDEIP